MSIKNHPFVEENTTLSQFKNQGSTDNQNQKNNPIIRKDNNSVIIIDLSQKKEGKLEEDDKSGKMLKPEEKIKAKTSRPKFLTQYEKNFQKYSERIQERTMRLELEKADQETERIKKEYEERNSYKYIFDDNPQFQKMVKSIQQILIIIFFISLFSLILNSIVYFKLTRKRKVVLAFANVALSIGEISFDFLLIISLQLGLLKDPNLSKAFRLFVISEFILQIVSFLFNLIIPFMMHKYLYKYSTFITIIIYFFYILIISATIYAFKFCYFLFMESLLILFNKKTEYAILMINEQFPGTISEFNINQKNSNKMNESENNSALAFTQTELNFSIDNAKKMKNHKDDEKYRNYNYFNRFHYSVTSDRKIPKYFK